MSTIAIYLRVLDFQRTRTLLTLDEIAKQPEPTSALGFRPGPGRAHIAWQLCHIAITEELFATERLFGRTPAYSDLVPRFKGGSTPDDQIPSMETIRELLTESRTHLQNALAGFTDQDLAVIPDAFRERGWTLERILQVLAWHEPHHQGQAHITLNLWKALT
ncbi:MAG: DinB family protein [Planctomycetaceae bacterium]|nr:DinB family protein [Planctomycetaceae bacterium]